MSSKITAVQTSAGEGRRLWPLSLYRLGTILPKGLVRIMGTPIAELQVKQFEGQGIEDIYVITRFLENRDQMATRMGDGTRYRDASHPVLNIQYSHPSDDQSNNGSGDAILTNIAKKNLTGDSVWLPNDNLFEVDLGRIVEAHRESQAVVTMMTVPMPPRATLLTYGLIKADPFGRVEGVFEKPKTLDDIMHALQIDNPDVLESMRVPVNTAGYVLNNDLLAEIAKEPWVVEARKNPKGFDMAGNLLPGLVEHGYPVKTYSIDAWGDLGTPILLLDTLFDALSGKFNSINRVLEAKGYYHDSHQNVWIDKKTLCTVDKNGKTLKERMELGTVTIGPNTFIAQDVIIEDGVTIRYSNLEKDVMVCQGAKLDHAYVMPYCRIGKSAQINRSALGLDVEVESSDDYPTLVSENSVLGPQVRVPVGTRLADVTVFPGYSFSGPKESHATKVLKASPREVYAILKEYMAPIHDAA